ncbi:MAG: hypothetical protein WC872_03845 [Candidatus Absconditabacterales bacterium]
MIEDDIKKSIDEIKQKLLDDQNDEFDSVKFNDETRAKIGKIFVWGFFIALFGSILFTIGYNLFVYYMVGQANLFLKLETVVTLIGSIIGTPLGFVMGYYFKADKD